MSILTPEADAAGGFRFHAGERKLQTRAGVRDKLEVIGRHAIRDAMPDEHRLLFERLPHIVVGARDADGRPWATMLTGRPGFVRTPDARTLTIAALPAGDDPFAPALAVGAPVGLLAIEFATRRRNRANGRIAGVGDGGFRVAVEESFGNCPKYIVPRELAPAPRDAGGAVSAEGPRLSDHARSIVAAADTFFIATVAQDGIGGADVSHRGGPPGFVTVGEDGGRTVLSVPDYSGNAFFNSFGNLETDDRAGLLFVDFASGDALSLTGRATVTWTTEGREWSQRGGTGRTLAFTVERGRLRPGAVALRAWPAPTG